MQRHTVREEIAGVRMGCVCVCLTDVTLTATTQQTNTSTKQWCSYAIPHPCALRF